VTSAEVAGSKAWITTSPARGRVKFSGQTPAGGPDYGFFTAESGRWSRKSRWRGCLSPGVHWAEHAEGTVASGRSTEVLHREPNPRGTAVRADAEAVTPCGVHRAAHLTGGSGRRGT
jgi:hypothetical protein